MFAGNNPFVTDTVIQMLKSIDAKLGEILEELRRSKKADEQE